MKKSLIILVFIIIITSAGAAWKFMQKKALAPVVTNFEECVAAGNTVMESYPRQCRHGEQTFVENIGNELDKANLIRISSPRPNQGISSPLTITGEARGNWFFEASFPVTLEDANGRTIAQGIATAQSDWMTTEFVPYEATLTFALNTVAKNSKGALVLHKDNPSGLPEHDDMLQVPVVFAEGIGSIPPPPATKVCTQEAMLCPDGSTVGRTGPNCEFAKCPLAGISCKKDSECPSSQYVCQATQGTGTVCPESDPSCVPAHTIIAGECKIKAGYHCSADADCASGNLCHKNICISPIGRRCNGPNDTSCPTDFECVQSCGPPVVRNGDDTPPTYVCQLKGYMRPCPICLAINTLIDTPTGAVPVQQLQAGDPIWTVSKSGERTAGVVAKISKTLVLPGHTMIKLALDDGRTVFVSSGHPTADRRTVADLVVGDTYNGARVVATSKVPYGSASTYDILPSGSTGFYWANGILLGSTLSL